MDAKARLANLLDRIVECEAERRVALTKRDDASADNWEFRREQARREALALLDTEPVPPPPPAGPVTLTFVVGDLYQGLCEPWDTRLVALGFARGQQVRVTIEDAATPFTLLTPAEVERRAREWVDGWRMSPAFEGELIRALTAPTGKEGV